MSKISNSKHGQQKNKSKKHRSKQEFIPEGNLILVKVSHVNEALVDLKTELFDEDDREECHFVRILRVGPEIKYQSSTTPGSLVIVHKSAGLYLQKLSDKFGEDYYLVKEEDIQAHVDL